MAPATTWQACFHSRPEAARCRWVIAACRRGRTALLWNAVSSSLVTNFTVGSCTPTGHPPTSQCYGTVKGGKLIDILKDGSIRRFMRAGFTCTGQALRRPAPDGAPRSKPGRSDRQTLHQPPATLRVQSFVERWRWMIEGRVQWVEFRASCNRRSLDLGIRG